MKMRIAINGFGRIGRNFLRTIMADSVAQERIDVVAINIGPSTMAMLAHMFKYDTLLGPFPGTVAMDGDYLCVDGKKITIIAEPQAEHLDWGKLGIEWVVDASGHYTTGPRAQLHRTAGAKKVLITAPAQQEDITIIPGVNDAAYDAVSHHIVSLGSCTTNAVLPMLKVLHEACTVRQGFMTTIHSYTNSQTLLDVERSDPRRARAAALNIIPTTTGAMKVLDRVYPALKGKIGGCAVRVPVAKVSLIDLTVVADADVSVAVINDSFRTASSGVLGGIIGVSDEPLVSSDYSGNAYSVTLDAQLTDVKGQCVKLFGWYDNEWGYSERLKDFLLSRCQ